MINSELLQYRNYLDKNVLKNTIKFLKCLKKSTITTNFEITPTEDCAVNLEIMNEEIEIYFSIGKEKMIGWLELKDEKPIYLEGRF